HFAFEWRDAFSVDVAALDSQYKNLFQLINRLYQFSGDYSSVAGMLDTIFDTMKQHFTYEENLMNQYGYTYLEQQKQEHQIMLEEILKFKRDLTENKQPNLLDFLTSLKERLIMHTLIEDKKYRSFFREKGVS
ncbi:MAG TPA: bacteriohemerythrin, partial [Bacteroidetes bacterium]|nr:bacteriohemerythrin [Bacteroidota bacterium]